MREAWIIDAVRTPRGKGKKDVVEVSTPGGGKSYEVVRVEYK